MFRQGDLLEPTMVACVKRLFKYQTLRIVVAEDLFGRVTARSGVTIVSPSVYRQLGVVTSSASLANQIRRRPFGPQIMLSSTMAVVSEAESSELQVYELRISQRWSVVQTWVSVTLMATSRPTGPQRKFLDFSVLDPLPSTYYGGPLTVLMRRALKEPDMEHPSEMCKCMVLVVAFPFACELLTSDMDRRLLCPRRVASLKIAQEQMKRCRIF
jgi:hypothetical protein